MSTEAHDSRLLRTDLPPTDSEARVLAELSAAAATTWSAAVMPPRQFRPPNLRGGSWAEITSAAALLSLQQPPRPSGAGAASGGESGYNSHISVATIPADYRYIQEIPVINFNWVSPKIEPLWGISTIEKLSNQFCEASVQFRPS